MKHKLYLTIPYARPSNRTVHQHREFHGATLHKYSQVYLQMKRTQISSQKTARETQLATKAYLLESTAAQAKKIDRTDNLTKLINLNVKVQHLSFTLDLNNGIN